MNDNFGTGISGRSPESEQPESEQSKKNDIEQPDRFDPVSFNASRELDEVSAKVRSCQMVLNAIPGIKLMISDPDQAERVGDRLTELAKEILTSKNP